MRLLMTACAILALATPPALAADCTTTADADALKITAMRQQLIGAALFCGEGNAYHRFAASFHDELQNTDAALKSFFTRHGLADGAEAFKARAARLSDQERARDGTSFCAGTHALLVAAAAWHGKLAGFVEQRAHAVDVGGICKAFAAVVAAPALPRPRLPVRLTPVTLPTPILPISRPVPAAASLQPAPAPAKPNPEPLRARRIVPATTEIAMTMPSLPPLPEEPAPPRITRTGAQEPYDREYDREAEERSWRAWDIAHRDDWRAQEAPQPRTSEWYPPPPPGWYPPPPYYRGW